VSYDVTVITPVYNGENYIEECVNSVLCQVGVKVQHIVVDDGSIDKTCELLQKYPSVQLIKQDNAGAPSARNYGLSKALGRYIKFLDADDYLIPGCLEKQLQFSEVKGHSERFIGYGYRDVYWENRRIFKRKTERYDLSCGGESIEERLAKRISKNIVTSLPLYPRSALEQVGGFDLSLKSSQEWNLNIRLVLSGYRFVFDDVHCYVQRFHNSPSRISNRKLDPEAELLNDLNTYNVIEEYMGSYCVREAWSQRLRRKSADFLIAGFDSEGRSALNSAREMCPDADLSNTYKNPYRSCVRVFGEVGAASAYRKILGFARRVLY